MERWRMRPQTTVPRKVEENEGMREESGISSLSSPKSPPLSSRLRPLRPVVIGGGGGIGEVEGKREVELRVSPNAFFATFDVTHAPMGDRGVDVGGGSGCTRRLFAVDSVAEEHARCLQLPQDLPLPRQRRQEWGPLLTVAAAMESAEHASDPKPFISMGSDSDNGEKNGGSGRTPPAVAAAVGGR